HHGPIHLRERCGSVPHRGCDRVPRHLVGLGHPPPAQAALAIAPSLLPDRHALRATRVTGTTFGQGADSDEDLGLTEPGSNPTEAETSLVRSSAVVAVG